MTELETYVDEVAEREALPRQPVIEAHTPQVINDQSHTCKWVKEEKQTHPTLISYVCSHRKCGRGKLIDESTDTISNY